MFDAALNDDSIVVVLLLSFFVMDVIRLANMKMPAGLLLLAAKKEKGEFLIMFTKMM